jgi:hypothetical protein
MASNHTTHQLPLGWRASFGALPPLAGKFSGSAIVLGRAPGWVDELDAALDVTGHAAPIFAVNHQEGHYPGLCVEHVVSVHAAKFPAKDKRRADTLYHSPKPPHVAPRADVFWPMPGIGGSGSSALLATLIALNMGHSPAYVAGVHLMESTCLEDEEGRKTLHSYKPYQDGWVSMREQLLGRVFSVSPRGTFLRELLGG